MRPAQAVQLRVDGVAVEVDPRASVLEACDAAGRYVPRLCHYPGLGCGGTGTRTTGGDRSNECGLCVVRVGDGSTALACVTRASSGMEITTDDPDLRNQRLEHLAPILAGHPHVCLSCPEADGCTRDECTYGNPPEARCCEMFGWCELGRLVDFVDSARSLPRRPVAVARAAVVEGRIRLEWGLCVGCGRCVLMCGTAEPAGQALEMTGGGLWAGAVTARTRKDSLRTSGCTFCGLCVLVCPAGALSAPGEEGARWLAGRRERFRPADQVLPPQVLRAFDPASLDAVPRDPGVFELTDLQGQVVTIKGVADLREGLAQALTDPACGGAAFFRLELDPLFTQRESELLARYAREHGHLPPASGFDDDLFADD